MFYKSNYNMYFEWMFTSLVSKSNLYIFVLSLTIALLLNYFKLSNIPWLLLFLIAFVTLTPLWFIIKKACHFFYNWIKKTKGNIEETAEIKRLINIAFIGMDVIYKVEALNIIKKYTKSPYDKYEFIVKEPHKFAYSKYTSTHNNPFIIDMRFSYYPLLSVNEQYGYSIIKFDSLFYKLIVKHSDEIMREYGK